MPWIFKDIDKAVKKDSFDCDSPALNEYLKKYARQNHEKGLGKTCVVVDEKNLVLGFYTTSSAQVNSDFLPEKIKSKLPKYPIPAIRIARLAIDKTMKGKGLGKELLTHALMMILEVSKKVGIFLVVVDAKDQNAANFYKKYGFVQFQDDPQVLFLTVDSFLIK